MSTPFSFDVPATSAHLGPGFGVVGLALDFAFQVTVDARGDVPGITIERGHAASLEDDAESEGSAESRRPPRDIAVDMRHDAALRAVQGARDQFNIKLPKSLRVAIDDERVARGYGLGTNSADLVAGVTAATHFAKTQPSASAILDLAVQLGADPGHAVAAILGGLAAAVHVGRHDTPTGAQADTFVAQQHDIHADWRAVLAIPDLSSTPATTFRVVPPTLPHGTVARTSGRLTGMLRALAAGDEELLGRCIVDETHVPFRLDGAPGTRRAIEAGRSAGAAGVTISGHGPALIALTMHEDRADAIGEAMCEAFESAEVHASPRTCRIAQNPAVDGNS